MKIDNGALPPTPGRIDQAGQVGHSEPGRVSTRSATGDAIAVSSEAQLVAQAASQVGEVRDEHTVRPDVVERAKAAVADGTLGADLDRLADRIIDGLLDE
jgi:anti-sigma28 factor (negative regulator of flagellin synthesis)